MKKIISSVFLITIICLTVFSVCQAKSAEKSLALDFKLQDLNGSLVSLSDYRGKNSVIVLFWTTWCPYCRVELDQLNKRYAQLVKEGFEVFAIDVKERSLIVNAFLKKRPLDFKVLLDSDARVAHSYQKFGVPTFILINKEGLVVFNDNYFPEDKYRELLLQ